MSLNRVSLLGNLGQPPEIRNTQNGEKVATFSLATTEKWKDQSGEQQTRTEWHKIVIFGKLSEVVEKYVKKGSKLYIEGQLRTRKWTDNQGTEKYTTEVVLTQFNSTLVMLDSPKTQQQGGQQNQQQQTNNAIDELDDEVPF